MSTPENPDGLADEDEYHDDVEYDVFIDVPRPPSRRYRLAPVDPTPDNPDSLAATRYKIRRRMFVLGIPVGSDDLEALKLGAAPLHLCDPDVPCRWCKP